MQRGEPFPNYPTRLADLNVQIFSFNHFPKRKRKQAKAPTMTHTQTTFQFTYTAGL